jgi:hypothetical protein
MKKHMKKLIYISLIITLSLYSCYTYQTQNYKKSKNLAYLYNPNESTIHPEYNVFHTSNNESELNIRILKKELFFIRTPNSQNKYANIKIRYKIYNSFKSKNITDSATVYYDFIHKLTKDTIDLSIKLKLPKDSTFSAIIKLTDLNRERTEKSYIFIDKQTYSHENIKFYSINKKKYLFHNWADTLNTYKIFKRYSKPVYAIYYKNNLPLALPPFSTSSIKEFPQQADSIFKITNDTIKFHSEGTYLLCFDTTVKKGTTIIVSNQTYPEYIIQLSAGLLLTPIRILKR